MVINLENNNNKIKIRPQLLLGNNCLTAVVNRFKDNISINSSNLLQMAKINFRHPKLRKVKLNNRKVTTTQQMDREPSKMLTLVGK